MGMAAEFTSAHVHFNDFTYLTMESLMRPQRPVVVLWMLNLGIGLVMIDQDRSCWLTAGI